MKSVGKNKLLSKFQGTFNCRRDGGKWKDQEPFPKVYRDIS